MAVAFAKALHLVLDRWAVAGTPTLDRAGEQRRPRKIVSDDFVRAGIRPRDRTMELRLADPVVERGHGPRLRIARLLFEPRPVDRSAVEARRGAGLEAALAEAD